MNISLSYSITFHDVYRLQVAEKIKLLGRAAMVPELNAMGRLMWQRTLAKELDLEAYLAIQV